MPRNGQQLLNHIESNHISESAQREVISKMVDAIDNAALRHGLIDTDGGERLFNAGNHVANYAHGAFELNEEKINKALDNMSRNSLRDALLATVPGMDPPITYYDLFAQDPETKKAIDDGLKVLNDYADLNWDLSFTVPQENLINTQQDNLLNISMESDFSELSGGRVAPGYNAPQQDAGEIINDLRTSLNIPRTQVKENAGPASISLASLQEKLGQTNTNLAKHTASKVGSLGNINDREIKKALDKFDTKRLFGQRASRSHQRVTDAVNSMVTLKNSGEGSLSASLGQVENRQEKMQRAVQWMSAAQEMFYQADIYVNQKDPLTFAGRDRKNGAKDLRNIAAREIRAAEDAIRAAGGEEMLQEVYRGVAQQKAMAAENLMSKMDISKPTQERNGRSIDKQVEDQKHEVRRLMLDSLAAHVSEMALHDSPQNTAGANFHNIRTHLEGNVKLAMAVYDHIEGNWNNKAELDKWVKDPGKMIQDIRTNGDYKDLGDRLMDYTKPLEHRGKVMEDANKAVKKEQSGRIMG